MSWSTPALKVRPTQGSCPLGTVPSHPPEGRHLGFKTNLIYFCFFQVVFSTFLFVSLKDNCFKGKFSPCVQSVYILLYLGTGLGAGRATAAWFSALSHLFQTILFGCCLPVIPVLTHCFCLSEFLPPLLPSLGFMNSCCFPSAWKLPSWFALKKQKDHSSCYWAWWIFVHFQKMNLLANRALYLQKTSFRFLCVLEGILYFWYVKSFILVDPLISLLSAS